MATGWSQHCFIVYVTLYGSIMYKMNNMLCWKRLKTTLIEIINSLGNCSPRWYIKWEVASCSQKLTYDWISFATRLLTPLVGHYKEWKFSALQGWGLLNETSVTRAQQTSASEHFYFQVFQGKSPAVTIVTKWPCINRIIHHLLPTDQRVAVNSRIWIHADITVVVIKSQWLFCLLISHQPGCERSESTSLPKVTPTFDLPKKKTLIWVLSLLEQALTNNLVCGKGHKTLSRWGQYPYVWSRNRFSNPLNFSLTLGCFGWKC